VNAWKVILSTLVIFIAGVVTGGLLVSTSIRIAQIRPRLTNNNGQGGAAAAGGMRPMAANPWQTRNMDLLRRMDRELDLTPDQRPHIEKIITASQDRLAAIWKPVAPQMNREMQAVRIEIRAELTPDQQKKFDGFAKPRANQDRDRRRGQTNFGPGSVSNEDLLNSSLSNSPLSRP